jgi:EamA domain-containing membrane protein RarD
MDELSRHGVVAVFTTWPLYGLGLAGLLSLLLSQLAYEAGPLRASLPAITVVGPVISLVIGVAVFDEPFRHTPVAVIAEAVGLVVVVCAVVLLTSRGPNSALRTHSPDRT